MIFHSIYVPSHLPQQYQPHRVDLCFIITRCNRWFLIFRTLHRPILIHIYMLLCLSWSAKDQWVVIISLGNRFFLGCMCDWLTSVYLLYGLNRMISGHDLVLLKKIFFKKRLRYYQKSPTLYPKGHLMGTCKHKGTLTLIYFNSLSSFNFSFTKLRFHLFVFSWMK